MSTRKVFLALTVGCARCHDHKYDPIPTKDYYSLLGVFKSSRNEEIPLAPEAVVKAYKEQKKRIDELQETIDDFVSQHSTELSQIMARKTSRYMVAASAVMNGSEPSGESKLDPEILERWVQYLKDPKRIIPT